MSVAPLMCALAYVGLAFLSFTRAQHFREIFRNPPDKHLIVMLRLGGWTSLLSGLLLSRNLWHWGIAIPAYLGIVSLAGIILVLLLAFRPRWSAALCVAAPLLALATLLQ